MDNNGLFVLKFDEEQKAAVARALMAVAEQTTNDDEIVLLNDSDDSSNYELLDVVDDEESECNAEQFSASTSTSTADKNCNMQAVAGGASKVAVQPPNTFITLTNLSAGDVVNVQVLSANEVSLLQAKSEAPVPVEITKVQAANADDIATELETTSNTATTDCITSGNGSKSESAAGNEEMQWFIDDSDNDGNNSDESNNDETLTTNHATNQSDDAQKQTPTKSTPLKYSFYCPECGIYCGDFPAWRAHTNQKHQFRRDAMLNVHQITNERGELCYQCKLCQKIFQRCSRIFHISDHYIETHMAAYLKCIICFKMFHSIKSMCQHLRNKHGRVREQRSYWLQHIEMRCPICLLKLENFELWKNHLTHEHQYFRKLSGRVHLLNDTTLACKTCGKKVIRDRKHEHLLEHEKYNSFYCKVCNVNSYSNLISCINHIKRAHVEQ